MDFKTKLSGVAAALAIAASAPSYAFMDYVIDETPYGGTEETVDKLNGAYQEVITFTPVGGGIFTFVTAAFGDFGQYLINDGTSEVDTALKAGAYDLYAVFTSSGLADTNGAFPVFSGAVGDFELYLDVNDDTVGTLGATGSDPVTLVNTADDLFLASSDNLAQAFGILVPPLGGFFDLTFFDIELTMDGENYFVSPDPFYVRAVVDGDFDNFVIAGTQVLTGDVSVVFVPEPATLTLFGAAIAGLGVSARRRRKGRKT